MFGVLFAKTLPKTHQFTEKDLFEKYGVLYQLYVESQQALMEEIANFHKDLEKMLQHHEIGEAIQKEYGELNFAKYIWMAIKDPEIVTKYSDGFFQEMVEFMSFAKKNESL